MSSSDPNLDALIRRLNVSFKDQALLQTALTHRSVHRNNNERLEFLGDGILNFVIADEIYDRYPTVTEGDLSRIRASLVNKPGLAQVAQVLQLSDYIRLGSGELKSGGHRRNSILADAVEAIFGAIYLDQGFNIAKQTILQLYAPQLDAIPSLDDLKDPKTRLQEILQSRQLGLPVYEVVHTTGKPHAQTFTVICQVQLADAQLLTKAQGQSRRKAEQQAAEQMLPQINAQL